MAGQQEQARARRRSATAMCRFGLDHYRELIAAARAGGYRFAFFDRPPQAGDLLLRHDVDISIEAALELARVEAELDVRSTYFLMTESVFYNLGSDVGRAAVGTLRDLGHRVGLHPVYPQAAFEPDERFDPVIAWHNPEPGWMSDHVGGVVNVMEPPFFDPAHYRSDSNQLWRFGCPHEELAAGAFEWLQLMTHPVIWVHAGASMAETMENYLEAERRLRREWLRQDRIDL